MDIVETLITQGGLGLMAGVFLWLYIQERREHKETRTKYEGSLEAKRVDAKETLDNITEPVRGISQGIQQLNDKIVVAQNRRRG